MHKPVYDELITFIASGATTKQVADWQASDEAKAVVWSLVARKKAGEITPDEKRELDGYQQLEYILRQAKIRALQILQNQGAMLK